jgi:hypothetical protein
MSEFPKRFLCFGAELAVLLLASCTPSTRGPTARAEAAVARAEIAATQAEHSADQARDAANQVSKAADEADSDVRRANDAVSRFEGPRGSPCELAEKPTPGSRRDWCLMVPPVRSFELEIIDWRAPRSKYCVKEIFDTERECHASLIELRRPLLKERHEYNAFHRNEKWRPIRMFCAACANGDSDYED